MNCWVLKSFFLNDCPPTEPSSVRRNRFFGPTLAGSKRSELIFCLQEAPVLGVEQFLLPPKQHPDGTDLAPERARCSAVRGATREGGKSSGEVGCENWSAPAGARSVLENLLHSRQVACRSAFHVARLVGRDMDQSTLDTT